jgi:hypothetical protein
MWSVRLRVRPKVPGNNIWVEETPGVVKLRHYWSTWLSNIVTSRSFRPISQTNRDLLYCEKIAPKTRLRPAVNALPDLGFLAQMNSICGINPAIFNSDKAHPRKVNRIEPRRRFWARSIRLILPSIVFTQSRPKDARWRAAGFPH